MSDFSVLEWLLNAGLHKTLDASSGSPSLWGIEYPSNQKLDRWCTKCEAVRVFSDQLQPFSARSSTAANTTVAMTDALEKLLGVEVPHVGVKVLVCAKDTSHRIVLVWVTVKGVVHKIGRTRRMSNNSATARSNIVACLISSTSMS